MFLASEQVEQTDEDVQLPVVDAGRRKVEGVDMNCEERQEVGEERNGHAGSGKCRESDEEDHGGQVRTQCFDTTCRS